MRDPEACPAIAEESFGPGLPGGKHWGLRQLRPFQLDLSPLPTPKKYLYVFPGHCFANSNVTGNLHLRLQGLGPEEVQKAGLGELDQKKSQELAGNAFTSNIFAAIILAILVNWK